MLFWVLTKRLLKKLSPRLFYGSSSSKGWLCMCDLMLAKRHSWKKFLSSLAKLGNCHNWPIRRKSTPDFDVIWTRNLLIWSQSCHHFYTKSGNSQLHNRDLWFCYITCGTLFFWSNQDSLKKQSILPTTIGLIKLMCFCFWEKDRSTLIFCYIFNKELNVQVWN